MYEYGPGLPIVSCLLSVILSMQLSFERLHVSGNVVVLYVL